MKKVIGILLTLLLNLANYEAQAYDFSVVNTEGVEIYYKHLGDGRVEVTSGPTKYSGDIIIPEEVNYANISMYKVTSIGKKAFFECEELSSIIIGNNVTYIEDYAFQGCSGLISIKFSDSLENTGIYAFWKCIGLTSLNLPDSMNGIGGGAFQGCTGLQAITIPNNVTSIGTSAFAGCTEVKKITIGKNVAWMGGNALACGDNVEIVSSCIEEPFVINGKNSGSMTFRQGTFKNAILYVPDGTVEKYKATNGWKDFVTIKPISESYKYNLYYVVDGEIYKSYEIKVGESIPSEIEPTKEGYTFSGWSEIPETMPAHDVIVTGSFSPNQYTIIYMIDGKQYSKETVDYGSKIEPPTPPNKEGYHFVWHNYPETMPAYDITINGSYIENITLTITSKGKGIVTYNGETIQDGTSMFTVNEGSSATITFTPDAGYRIKGVKLNNTDVTASVANNQYTISNIKSDNTLEVEFEAIIHTLNIVAVGNGNVDYNGIVIRNQSQSYSVQEGSSVVFSFAPDAGYRVGSVKVNNTDVTASVTNNSYTISNITANTTLTVTFEAIPPTTYAFTISAVGNGTVTYDGNTVRGKTSSFTVVEGTNAVVTFSADEGYRLKSVKLGNTDVTSSVANNQYTINNIKANTSLEVTFEAIPTYALGITASGNGSVTYDGTAVRGKTQTFTVIEGTSATVNFAPDAGYRIKSIKVNNIDVTSSVSNNQYTINNINANTSIVVEFEESDIFVARSTEGVDITFKILSFTEKTCEIYGYSFTQGNRTTYYSAIDNTYTGELTIPQIANGYSVIGIGDYSFYYTKASIINVPYGVKYIGNQAFGLAAIEEISLPETLLRIDAGAFFACSQLVFISIPSSVEIIKNSVFVGCEKLASIRLNQGNLKEIGSAVFQRCTDLADLDIPEGVVSLGDANGGSYFIWDCKKMKTVSLPHSLSMINDGFIGNCPNLESITINRETPPIFSSAYSSLVNPYDNTSIYKSAILYVPKGAKNVYQKTNWWSNFENIQEIGEVTKYTLNITALGNGTASYEGATIRNSTSSFTVSEGSYAIVSFSSDEGYRIKNVKLDNIEITSSVINNQYTISNISADATLEVTFEVIPTYSLNITASGNGSVTYNGTAIQGKTQTFIVNEGTSATVTFAPDAGYRIASVKLNNTDVTASVANSSYTISNITANTTLEVTFEAIPPTTYALTISAEGNGYVAFDGNTIRSKTLSFEVVEGTNAVVKFSADEGYRLKGVKLDNTDVTSSVVNNQYTISNIKANTSLEVTFEAIPTYALNIVATGNGSASYNGVTIRNQSQNFTLREGASAVVSFSADNGYRIASVKVNNADVTSQIVDGKITINNITQNTNVEVVFEEIPPIVYALSITATGNGSVTYDGNTVKGKTSTFTIIEGSYVTVQLSADDGYRLKSITLNGQDVTENVVNNQYTSPKIMADAALVVVFEAIPTFALTIKSSAFGDVKFGDVVVTNRTETFSVREGASATMTFTPDDNGRLHSIMLNGTDITKELVNGQYTISDIRADQSVEAEFVEDITKVTDAGIAYTVTSYDEQTVVVAAGNYGNVLTVPASFTAKEKTWTVVGIDEDALKDNTALAAIIWNPEVAFTAKVSNPNLLLYVKDAQYAPTTIQNVVVNNQAENIVLVEAASGNDFYCPQAFTAKRISYQHNYSMISGYKTCQGWETLVLPFDVTMMINAKGQELTPYINWQYGNSLRPFWLYEMTTQGWKAGSAIKANTPYIISMPNNEMYDVSFNQTGNIQFIGTNVEVKASTDMTTGQHGNKRLVANYQTQEASADIYALNVSNEWSQNTAMEVEGSTFIRSLRSVHPFETYLTVEGSNAPLAIPLFENMPTGINEKLIMNSERFATATDWYTIDGRKLQGEPKQNGIYIIKGKKVRK